jgi:integrase
VDDATVRMREVIAQVFADQDRQRKLEHEREQMKDEPVRFFRTCAWAWYESRKREKNWKPSTARDYAGMLAEPDSEPRNVRGRRPLGRIMRAFGDLPMEIINAQDTEAFFDGLDAEKGIGPRVINSHRVLLAQVFAYAHERGWIAEDPMRKIRKRKEDDPAELVVYSPEQIHAIARELEADPTMAAMVVVGGFSGLRIGELLELRWRDVSFDGKRIHVQRSLSGGQVTTPKSRKTRSVPMASQVAEALAKLSERDRLTGKDDLIFPATKTIDGKSTHMDPNGVRARYVEARDTARMKDKDMPALSFHGLRHSFASRLAAKGVDIISIQEFCGHSDLKTTRRYMHFAERHDDAQKLSQAFSSGAEEVEQAEQVAEAA